jgi:SAM-dependent methyltransferase
MPLTSRKEFQSMIKKHLGDSKTVLDVGCGRGLYPVYKDYESTGVDIYEEDLRTAKEIGNYKSLLCCDINQLPYEKESFDAVTSIEVIEHITKSDGTKLLDKMEDIAKHTIIVSTPWGYDMQPFNKYNPYLEHKSGWYPQEFIDRGYKIYPFLKIRTRFRMNSAVKVIIYGVNIVARPLMIMFPSKLCNGFFAVKEKNVNKE